MAEISSKHRHRWQRGDLITVLGQTAQIVYPDDKWTDVEFRDGSKGMVPYALIEDRRVSKEKPRRTFVGVWQDSEAQREDEARLLADLWPVLVWTLMAGTTLLVAIYVMAKIIT